MLRQIGIRDLGVIGDATVELHPGLTVVTGETGAGKTMVVSGLGLLLGARADAGLIRAGASSCVVEGVVHLGDDGPAARVGARVAEAGGAVEDGEVVLVRTVTEAGRSRAHVGGRSAPIGVLAEVGQELVAVHGQADQWRLRQPAQHRAVVDDFGGPTLAEVRAEVADSVQAWRKAAAELRDLVDGERTRTQELELLTYQLDQIDTVDPQPGEDDTLRADEDRLANAEDLRTAAFTAQTALAGDDSGQGADVVSLVAAARRELSALVDHDRSLAALDERLAEIAALVAELSVDLSSYGTAVEADPARLAAVQERRAQLTDLRRRYGDTVEEVLAFRDSARAQALSLMDADDRVDSLREEVSRLEGVVAEAASRLSARRRTAADALAKKIQGELAELAMPGAVVDIAVTQRETVEGIEGEQVSVRLADGRRVAVASSGVDEVEIRVAANKGAEPRSVAKAVSGGELSRVMLAIEVATAGVGEGVPTFVFDEVDAGVGGRAGLKVGARLARLAESSQVVVVTHLAQVAAHADRHLVVRKSHDGPVTSSGVHVVEGEEQLAELARMMGGGDSVAGLEHARQLVAECRP